MALREAWLCHHPQHQEVLSFLAWTRVILLEEAEVQYIEPVAHLLHPHHVMKMKWEWTCSMKPTVVMKKRKR